MKIELNGIAIETEARTLAELLVEQHIDAGCVASAVNGEFVPRERYSSEPLVAGCRLEVLSPMQGG
ncbi:thiamine biosynthesis protein ThiS [Pantoea ananatis]|uniref:Thiamine biosynthesis protein ThiS n=1 Tax=Pantoea ananatis (strain AJ13355) TaxID=932677 RepID=A0A0H3L3P4_PANAA|nr:MULTISPECIES: sulfur carrier protein ThiS [Pantoea]MBA4821408.1 sulfur carrier protein ThiS [Pantoea ananatis]MCW1832381.1 sulfur carrier protein ThiS [Pantoea ananatis]MDC7866918.1 thiamine biosynthesis protein ThiS [Pantoea ananatis]MDI3363306.1 sulfur carrier protein ThiS [Pantoea sp. V108_6]MDI3413765.1 sulfur carrier protein ThiS [Pantoea sp. V106_11]